MFFDVLDLDAHSLVCYYLSDVRYYLWRMMDRYFFQCRRRGMSTALIDCCMARTDGISSSGLGLFGPGDLLVVRISRTLTPTALQYGLRQNRIRRA